MESADEVRSSERARSSDYAAVCLVRGRVLITINHQVITHAIDGWFQAPMVLRMVPKGLRPARRAVSTTVRMSASPSAAHIAR